MLQVSPPRTQPVFNAPPVVVGLAAVLITIHVALFYAGPAWQNWAYYSFAFSPARYGAGALVTLPGAPIYTFLSYAFLHAGWTHLLFNCLWLLIFGTVTARYLRPLRFLALSAFSAIAGAAAMLLMHWGQDVTMIGASGAVSGMMTASVPIMYGGRRFLAGGGMGDPHGAMPLRFGELVRHRGAIIFMVVLMALTVFSGASGFTGTSFMGQGQIAWEAHVGGFIGGLVAFYLLARDRMRP